ncbi:MAG: HIRAN domain-containing protein [Actinomycetes bacterium]
MVGEFYRQDALELFVSGREVGEAGTWEEALQAEAALVPEPENPHDRNAVRVDLSTPSGWVHVGYISRDHARAYQKPLSGMVAEGLLPVAEARVCRNSRGGLAVYLHLSDPDACVLANRSPEGAQILQADRPCAVTGENRHQDVLEALGQRASETGPTNVWASLHPSTVPSGKYKGEPTLEVRVEGDRVGYLSAARAQPFLQDARTEVLACQAVIYRGTRNVEVQVWLPRAT